MQLHPEEIQERANIARRKGMWQSTADQGRKQPKTKIKILLHLAWVMKRMSKKKEHHQPK